MAEPAEFSRAPGRVRTAACRDGGVTKRRRETLYRVRWLRASFSHPHSLLYLSRKKAEAKCANIRKASTGPGKRPLGELLWIDIDRGTVVWEDWKRESPESPAGHRAALQAALEHFQRGGYRTVPVLSGLRTPEAAYALWRELDREDGEPEGYAVRAMMLELPAEDFHAECRRLDAIVDAWLGDS